MTDPTTDPATINDLLAPLQGRVGRWAERLGIDPRTLWRLRNGLVEKPHAGTVALLAAGLKVKRTDIIAAIRASYDQAQS
jgi:hypothetical protein